MEQKIEHRFERKSTRRGLIQFSFALYRADDPHPVSLYGLFVRCTSRIPLQKVRIMAAVSVLFFLIAVACGVFAFGKDGGDVGFHIGFIIGIVGFVSFTVAILARWAAKSLDSVPGQFKRRSR
ncbi:MAG: hypothetical protein KF691_07385 [Phycisphaeraceae bacterium]|nr:hypothetical protein [Phycisphaeraceae bacterium]